ncbi:L,D-transpeptidase [Fimbriimonas ginsengisoli]|uniref:L,D-transpeptidase n=1 Tax=Fimbriimonas ginsengisoli TaxID=1005039 RepID=UPI001D0DDB4F|nr:L,D-transpeptidase [Fimbriimonas ginsengisoli]
MVVPSFLLTLSATVFTCLTHAAPLATIDAITFADQPNRLYLPMRDVSHMLRWQIGRNAAGLTLHGHSVPMSTLRSTQMGARLIAVSWLSKAGAIVNSNSKTGLTTVKDAKRVGRAFYVRRGMKRVFVNKKTQMMVAFQGRRTVFRSKVSTGREGKNTPSGIFRADGQKEKVHLSHLYANVPLPWAVHIVGNIFIHGYGASAGHSSHGCIRLPMSGGNPARWFYYWVERGTPVTILGKWPAGARR